MTTMIRWVWVCVLPVLLVPVSAQDDVDLSPPVLGEFDPVVLNEIDLMAVPVLPEVTEHALAIYARGQEAGRDAERLAKVGDCMTASVEYFMGPFGAGDYDLNDYEDLQAVIDAFDRPARDGDYSLNAFASPGLAADSGLNVTSVLDSIFADPDWCEPNESALACEYRVTGAAVALIMFGTNDVAFFEPDFFDYYMRQIILETINSDIVPILYTIPTRPEFPDKVIDFNKVIVSIARDYDLPLVNLWAAIQELPDEGIDPLDPIHLSIPPDERTGDLTEANLQYGYTVRNLITLQTLHRLLEAVES